MVCWGRQECQQRKNDTAMGLLGVLPSPTSQVPAEPVTARSYLRPLPPAAAVSPGGESGRAHQVSACADQTRPPLMLGDRSDACACLTAADQHGAVVDTTPTGPQLSCLQVAACQQMTRHCWMCCHLQPHQQLGLAREAAMQAAALPCPPCLYSWPRSTPLLLLLGQHPVEGSQCRGWGGSWV
jgi:hypothetical protein